MQAFSVFAVGIVLLIGCGQPIVGASLTDQVIDGLISFGRSMGDATKGVVNTFREWGDRVSPPKKVLLKGERLEPIITRLCGHPLAKRRLAINCLEKDERHLLHSSWKKCLGRASREVQSFHELMHWFCHLLQSADDIEGLGRMQDCVLKDVDHSYAMTLYRLCAKNLP